jgi:uncharacterized membrane protein YdbT with pleckstrin-like domain
MTESDAILFVSRPTMFRSRPFSFLLYLILVPAIVGAVLLLFWWLKCRSTTLTVTEHRLILRKGILSEQTNEVRHQDVRDIQIGQTFWQRLFGIGSIEISSAGQTGVIVAADIRDPQRIAALIRQRQ